METKLTIGLILVVLVVVGIIALVFHNPVPPCSPEVIKQLQEDKDNSEKGIITYRVLSDCKELHE